MISLCTALVAHAPIGMAVLDTEMRFRLINPTLADINGFSVEYHLGRSVHELLPTLAADAEPVLRAVLDEARPFVGVELRGTTPAAPGVERVWLEDFYPILGPERQSLGIGIICVELTDEQQALQALHRSEQNLRESLAEERRARMNAERAAERIMRVHEVTTALSRAITPSEVAEIVVEQGIGPFGFSGAVVRLINDDEQLLEPIYISRQAHHFPTSTERLPIDKDIPPSLAVRLREPIFCETRDAVLERFPLLGEHLDTSVPGSVVALPLMIGDRAIGAIGCSFVEPRIFDAEERAFLLALTNQCAQALDRARLYTAAQQAVTLRDRFLAMASHDLRTPLTALLGQAQLLERRLGREAANEALRRSARVITQQARRLQRLVAQLLDVSRVQSDRLVVDLQPIDLCRVLEEIAEDIRPTLHEHSLVLHYPSQPIQVLGDELRLGQVFHNLIANAIKYSPDGGVVRVELTTSATSAIVQVSDSGIGIPIEAQQHLFERFYRAPNAEALRVEGMGIGLFVVREIVQRHGGSITVVSAEGQGSRFTVNLPRSLSTVVADQIDQNGVEQES
ncbi:MAG: hypothetical protein OHK0050_40300 [Roseiflexaceae bacterium]